MSPVVFCRRRIFDFDDWNDHAVANYRPYLTSDSLDSSISASWYINPEIDLDNLGGRIVESLSLHTRSQPYVVRSDITVMPEATLHIYPDVVMEFAPNVGILVLGTLKAVGVPGHEIIMRPMKRETMNSSTFANAAPIRSSANLANLVSMPNEKIRLCKDGHCSASYNEGELEWTRYLWADFTSYPNCRAILSYFARALLCILHLLLRIFFCPSVIYHFVF